MLRKNLEDLLYWKPLKGCPDPKLKIYCEFEVGGAHEDFGFVAEYDGKIIATGRNVNDLLEKLK